MKKDDIEWVTVRRKVTTRKNHLMNTMAMESAFMTKTLDKESNNHLQSYIPKLVYDSVCNGYFLLMVPESRHTSITTRIHLNMVRTNQQVR